jgi:hypothetical protein
MPEDCLNEWLLESIRNARSLDRLKFLQSIIKEDKASGFEWTQNEEYMEGLRKLWIQRKTELVNVARKP